MKKSLFSFLLLVCVALQAMAVPAYPGLIVFRQPNSEITLSIYLKGDEKVHWAETVDGYSLVHSDDGSLVYAAPDGQGGMMATEHIAVDKEMRSPEVNKFLETTPKHLRFSKAQVNGLLWYWEEIEMMRKGPKTMSDVTGHKKFLVILFGFDDNSFTLSKASFKKLFNQVNYSMNNAIGSVHDYYYDVSQGQFSLSVDVVGPYVGEYASSYYSHNYGDFAREAVEMAANDADFSIYDNDNDGYIDGLHIIFAGHGQEATGNTDQIWSHKSGFGYDAPVYNNTIINVYSCSPEFNGSYGNTMTNIGVICHELGHVFGAPDYYDTDYSGNGGEYPGLGEWDIMSSGSWNRGGISPAQHNPYTKIYIYHWADCDTLDGTPKHMKLNPAENSNNDFYRVNTSTEGDFFLIENRQKIKWDLPLPGTGMLVYHIHPSAYGSHVSNKQHPQQIYIIARSNDTFPTSAVSSYGNLNNSTTPYPGTSNRDSLTDNSVPWFRPWSGVANNTPFYNISENGDLRTVYFTVQDLSADVMDIRSEAVSNHHIELNWERYGSYNTLILMSKDNIFGTPQGVYSIGDTVDGGGIVVSKGSESRKVVGNLEEGTHYYFKLFSRSNRGVYSDGVTTEATTWNIDAQEWTCNDFEEEVSATLPQNWTGDGWATANINSNNVLTCRKETLSDSPEEISCIAPPFDFDTIHSSVLSMRVRFTGNCDSNVSFKVEYRANPTSEWQTIETVAWHMFMPTWSEIYVHMPKAGQYSLLRFTATMSDTSQMTLIDDVCITIGCLVDASSDDNGTITPYGKTIFGENDTVTFKMIPLSGYELATLRVDGFNVAIDTLLVDEMNNPEYDMVVSGSHTIAATFRPKAGIEERALGDIKVWPNPSKGIINISCSYGSTVTLYDISGRKLQETRCVDALTTIDMTPYRSGIYLLRCDGHTTKVVKK